MMEKKILTNLKRILLNNSYEIMTVKINYKNRGLKKPSNNLVIFLDDKFSSKPLKKYISSQEFSYISDLLKTVDTNKNLFVFELSSKKKIIISKNKKI